MANNWGGFTFWLANPACRLGEAATVLRVRENLREERRKEVNEKFETMIKTTRSRNCA
jgi:cephalosporin hydroxylase